ncbi:MAG: nitroreductase family protein [Bacteroidales bacterium]|nr:MAG: nitroreductase family protein [Bacteroidales bacterium]
MVKNLNFLDLAKTRQSVRSYSNKPVEPEKIERCIEAARLAPSACNSQSWKFIIVNNTELKNALADAAEDRILSMNHFTKQAPVHVVVVREKPNFTSKLGGIVRNKTYTLIDLGIASEHFCLQAVSEGLGTCILGWFNEKKVKELLNIPRNKRAELIITLGYPASDEIREKKRKDLTEIFSYNRY